MCPSFNFGLLVGYGANLDCAACSVIQSPSSDGDNILASNHERADKNSENEDTVESQLRVRSVFVEEF